MPENNGQTTATAPTIRDALLQSAQWRNLGPFRGGRVVAVAGDPVKPLVFYMGSTGGGVWKTTDAGLTWTNVSDEPVLRPGPGAYDKDMIALNQIVRHGGRYYAYYHGTGDTMKPRRWTTNVATSTDLVHWEKYSGNPLLPVEANKSSGILVHDGERFRLYTMHDEVHVHWPAGK